MKLSVVRKCTKVVIDQNVLKSAEFHNDLKLAMKAQIS